jgi:hypothetical protein
LQLFQQLSPPFRKNIVYSIPASPNVISANVISQMLFFRIWLEKEKYPASIIVEMRNKNLKLEQMFAIIKREKR